MNKLDAVTLEDIQINEYQIDNDLFLKFSVDYPFYLLVDNNDRRMATKQLEVILNKVFELLKIQEKYLIIRSTFNEAVTSMERKLNFVSQVKLKTEDQLYTDCLNYFITNQLS